MRRRRQNEGGYALLLVFALAAAVAVKFYLEIPRVAFEHQRNKEGLLVERGEQYIRAIKLYYRKNQKWPQNLEDLEKSQESRYLRKRYRDPMTGEDEWRLVHIDGAGRYTDSLIKKAGEEEEKRPDLLAARVQGIGSSAEVVDTSGDAASNNPALQRRASDRIIPGTSGEAGQGGLGPPGSEGGVAVPPEGAMSGLVGQPQVPGQSPGQAPVTTPPAAGGGGAASGGQGSSTGGGFGMSGGFGFGASPDASSPPAAPSPSSGLSGTAGAGSGPSPINRGTSGAGGQPNQALRLINQILSAPRQTTGQGGTFGPQGGTGVATGIGGLAGVASKKDMDGIMVYNEQTNYKKWEFVYDLKKELEAKGMMGGPTNPAGTNQSGTGQNPQRSTTGPGSMFGTMGQTPGKQ